MRLPRSLVRSASILALLPLLAVGKGCSADAEPPRITQAEAPLVWSPTPWTPVGKMSTLRAYHTATLLLNSQVLVVGGQSGNSTYLDGAELYDPLTKTWSKIPQKLSTARSHHTATLLQGGKVLVVGGASNGNKPVASAEIFDPATQTWSSAGTLSVAREDHAATLLNNGNVLITGGYDGKTTVMTTAELYTGGTTWTTVPGPAPRWKHTATTLADGHVLVAGGYSAPGFPAMVTNTAEIYDPTPPGSWSSAGTLVASRALHTATLLGNGSVLIVGGEAAGAQLASVELYTPNAMPPFTQTASLLVGREWHTATLLGNAKALVVGGLPSLSLAKVDLYDPNNAMPPWSGASNLTTGRYTHTSTLLGDGHVLVAGGLDVNSVYLDSAELYQPSPLGTACSFPDECVSGFCENSKCCEPPCCALLDGTACDDGNKCTEGDTCQSGGCKGTQKSCATPTSPCHDAACDQATGMCVVASSPKPDGAPCDDGNKCTVQDQCDMAGNCAGTTVECAAQDICHDPGTCDMATGLCDSPTKPMCEPPPVDPPKVPPSVVLCKSAKDCKTGFCVDHVCCDSACDQPCHSCALLQTAGKCTLEPKGVDLRHECEIGINCLSTCGGTDDGMCVGAGAGTQCRPITCTDETHGVTAATCSMKSPDCPTGDTIPFNCWPFRCAGPLGACFTTCSSVSECAPSLVCDPTHHCVAPPPVENNRNLGGCALAARPSSAEIPGLAALLALAAAAARRRARRRLS